MKKKILLSIVIIITLLGTIVLATEDPNSVNGIMPINETGEMLTPSTDANTLQNTTLVGEDGNVGVPYSIPEEWLRDIPEENWREDGSSKTTVQNDDFKGGEQVKVSSLQIDGNAFYAGEEITISDVDIYGDLFVAAQYIDIQNTNVAGNIFVAGSSVELDTTMITGNMFVAGKTVTLKTVEAQDIFGAASVFLIDGESFIYRNINVGAANISIDNTDIGRNANLSVETLNIGNSTVILGMLNYSSENEAVVAEGASVGSVNHSKIQAKTNAEEGSTMQSVGYSVVTSLVKAIFVCGFIYLFARGFIEKQKVENEFKHIAINTGKGLLWSIVIPIVAILLMCTGVAFGLSFVILALYFAMFVISMPVVAVSISTALTKNKELNSWKSYGITLLVALVIVVLSQIKYVGPIISIIVGLAGMGLIFSSLKNKVVKKEEKQEVINEEV